MRESKRETRRVRETEREIERERGRRVERERKKDEREREREREGEIGKGGYLYVKALSDSKKRVTHLDKVQRLFLQSVHVFYRAWHTSIYVF